MRVHDERLLLLSFFSLFNKRAQPHATPLLGNTALLYHHCHQQNAIQLTAPV
jgi:hypothetical protein